MIEKEYNEVIRLLRSKIDYLIENQFAPETIAFNRRLLRVMEQMVSKLKKQNEDKEKERLIYEKKMTRIFKNKDEQIEKLESICLIHGINDFPSWMAHRHSYLVSHAVFMQNNKIVKRPYLIDIEESR